MAAWSVVRVLKLVRYRYQANIKAVLRFYNMKEWRIKDNIFSIFFSLNKQLKNYTLHKVMYCKRVFVTKVRSVTDRF